MSPTSAPLFLVGFMGCGKTSVGSRLGELTGRKFVDVDAKIERDGGESVPAIIAGRGEAAFRELETELLAGLVGKNCIVGTGGGSYLRAANRRLIRTAGIAVWLDASLARCRERIGAGEGRPLWPADDALAQRTLFERRAACYALADLRVPADDPVDRVCEELLRRLGPRVP